MEKYIKKVEMAVAKKLSEKTVSDKKGFAAPKGTKKEDKKQKSINDFVVDFVADIRKKRMEMKNGN